MIVSLGSLMFLSPLWSIGFTAAVAVPLLVHLLSRGKGQRATFPAVRFVQQAFAETAQLQRVRQILLMALRIAALGLLVLAFMQPVWYALPDGAAAPVQSEGYDLVIVLDATASMRRTSGGETLFDRARRQAIALLGQLDPERDRASVVLLDRSPRALLPEPTAHVPLLIARLQTVQPTYQAGELADALRLAVAVAQRDPAKAQRRLRIDIFSDGQWTTLGTQALHEMIPGDARARLHVVGDAAKSANLAVFNPTVRPAHPVVGQRAVVSAEVANFSATAATPVLRLTLDGRTQTQRLRLKPFERTTVNFALTLAHAGPAVVRLTLIDARDAMAWDDETGLVPAVRSARAVHLLTRADADDPATAAYFLARALSPATAPGTGGVDLSIAPPAALTADKRNAAPRTAPAVWVIAEAGQLDADQCRSLERLVKAGDGAIWIADSPAAVAGLRRFGSLASSSAEVPLSPIVPAAETAWQARANATLGWGDFDAPILSVFPGPARSALLRQRFAGVMRGTLAKNAQPLLRFANGTPALAVQRVGQGRLAVFAASLRPAGTSFCKGPLIVPLLHQLLARLAPGTSTPANPHPGDVLNFQAPANAPLQWEMPGGMTANFAGDTAIAAHQPGLYRLIDKAGGKLKHGAWVELDPRESDLRPADDVQGMAVAGRDGAAAGASAAMDASTSGGATSDALTLRRSGVDLWPWLTLAALLTLMAEPLVTAIAARARHRA